MRSTNPTRNIITKLLLIAITSIACFTLFSSSALASSGKTMHLHSKACSVTLRDLPSNAHFVTSGEYTGAIRVYNQYVGFGCSKFDYGDKNLSEVYKVISPTLPLEQVTIARNLYVVYSRGKFNGKIMTTMTYVKRVNGGYIVFTSNSTHPNKVQTQLMENLTGSLSKSCGYNSVA
jgi:hypothetical protein